MTTTILGPLPDGLVTAVGYGAAALTLLCVVPLIICTILPEGHLWKAYPSPVTWGTWALVGFVATVGMARGGAPWEAWLLKGALSLGPVAVAVVAVAAGIALVATRRDRVSLAIGGAGTLIYFVLEVVIGTSRAPGIAVVAVLTAMAVDVVAAVPTWVRMWREPRSELITTYALALVSVLAVLATLPATPPELRTGLGVVFPWAFLAAGLLSFLAFQMASFIVIMSAGRLRERLRRPELVAS